METPAGQHPALALWATREARYAKNCYEGAGGPDSLRHLPGSARVLLTAPHAVMHARSGQEELADRWTGGLAEAVAELTGAAVLTCDGRPTTDPNHGTGGPFRQVLQSLLTADTVVFDLHGMADDPTADVHLGLGPVEALGAPPARVLAAELSQRGIPVGVNQRFRARGSGTVTALCQRSGTRAVQVEIGRRLRDPLLTPEAADRLVAALAAAVRALTAC